jgi:RNA polymerase sigma factor (sigma-70 family)
MNKSSNIELTRHVQATDQELVANYLKAYRGYGASSVEASEAFEPIFKRYWPFAVARATGRLGKDLATLYSEEIASDTLLTVLKRLNAGKEEVVYLKGLVIHSFNRRCSDFLERLLQGRRLSRAGIIPDGSEAFILEDGQVQGAIVSSLNISISWLTGEELLDHIEDKDRDANVEVAASRRELARQIRTLIAEMPENYQAPLIAQYFKGMSNRDIQSTYGLTRDQAKKRAGAGLKWLCGRLNGGYSDWLVEQ